MEPGMALLGPAQDIGGPTALALIGELIAVDGDFKPSAIKPRDWLSIGLLLRRHVTLLISPGSVGKSTLTMLTAGAGAARHHPWPLGYSTGNVLVVNTEDDLARSLY